MIAVIFAISTKALAGENLYRKPETKLSPHFVVPTTTNHDPSIQNTKPITKPGNLDSEILVTNSKFHAEGSQSLLPKISKGLSVKGLKVGDVVRANIIESVIAFPDRPTPVRAMIMSGELKGSVFVGEASLERNTKRIVITFKKFRSGHGADVFNITAAGLDSEGILGLEGEYESQEFKYFVASFFAAGAAAYSDATIQRDQNVLGNYVESPGVDTVSKKALAGSLTDSATHFNEKSKTAPEYSVLRGPTAIQILITDQATQ